MLSKRYESTEKDKDYNIKFSAKVSIYTLFKIKSTSFAFCRKSADLDGHS